METKGTLFLRSNHMHYSRPTMVSCWHQAREAEPKDYDVAACPTGRKDLHLSTYRHFSNGKAEGWTTSTEAQLSQHHLKKDYEVKETPKPFLSARNFSAAGFERETGRPKTGFRAVLPRHPADHNKMDLQTTYFRSFQAPYVYTAPPKPAQDLPDYSTAFRKCHSQFTDTADYRRHGKNIWQDESGNYANKDLKNKLLKHSNPITQHVL
ncbi:protein C9orf135-like [Polypterus senegalus]